MSSDADRAVEDVVRTSYGRLVALVAVRTNDLAAAEDALSEALEAALRTWPERGVPDSPEAWMLTAARRAVIGAHRRRATAERATRRSYCSRTSGATSPPRPSPTVASS
jgi:RNA polymerase sigma-70 factor, ECF subfamily